MTGDGLSVLSANLQGDCRSADVSVCRTKEDHDRVDVHRAVVSWWSWLLDFRQLILPIAQIELFALFDLDVGVFAVDLLEQMARAAAP